MKLLKRVITLAAAFLVGLNSSHAQKASNWRAYKAGDGLPESACGAIYFSPQNKLLVRHVTLPFVSELDGYRVTTMPASKEGKGRIYQSPGGQLWTVAPNGLQEFRNGTWLLHPISEMAASAQSSAIDPVPLYPIRQDLVLVLLPDRLLEINPQGSDVLKTRLLRLAKDTGLGSFTGMTRARSLGLWITGNRGLGRIPGPLRTLTPETTWAEYLLPPEMRLMNLQHPIELGPALADAQAEPQTIVTALAQSCTNKSKTLVRFDGRTWSAGKLEDQRLEYAWSAPDNSSWAMASEGLWHWPNWDVDPVECEEVSARKYYDMALEPGGAFWISTSDGLFRYAPLLWQTAAPLRKVASPVRCLGNDAEKRFCFISGNRFYLLEEEVLRDYPLPLVRERAAFARALFLVKSGRLILAAEDPESPEHDLLFHFVPEQGVFEPVNLGRVRVKALGLLKDGSLCVERSGTVPPVACAFERFDGRAFERFSEPPPASLGNHWRCAFATQAGDVWLASDAGVACLHDRAWRTYVSGDKSNPEGASCFVELSDGKIWCAVEDQIWEFDGRKWMPGRRTPERIHDLLRTKDGSIWVASNNGLLRYAKDAWVENSLEDGLPSTTVRDLFEDERGLWAATSRGLSLFHPEADPETDPPKTTIQKFGDLGNTAPEGSVVSITYSGRDKWKYTARERLLYSYRLDDREWSLFQESTRVTFTDLAPGNHYFQVRSMDRNCNVDPQPAQFEFAIVLPWYRETRLVLIACAGGAAALFFAGVAFNRHRQLLRSYAAVEAKVAERTEQLEIASAELFHSQKMNALGTLAAGIAHDFNNILSIIKGSAQVIEDNLDNPDKVRVRTDRIKTVVEQGTGIVKAMLGFSRDSGAIDAPCDINSIVQETIKLLGDRFVREVEVRFDPAPDLPAVSGTKDFIQQILLNFIFNAAESMDHDKLVRVSTRLSEKLPAEMVLAPASATACVQVSVQDSGCGIAPDNLSRIFEPFFTTKALSARRGTGLGLSMVYELAKKLGAGLAVDSVLNQGSTFTLFLPVRQSRTATKL